MKKDLEIELNKINMSIRDDSNDNYIRELVYNYLNNKPLGKSIQENHAAPVAQPAVEKTPSVTPKKTFGFVFVYNPQDGVVYTPEQANKMVLNDNQVVSDTLPGSDSGLDHPEINN